MASDSTKQERHAAAQWQYRVRWALACSTPKQSLIPLSYVCRFLAAQKIVLKKHRKRANITAEEVAAAAEKRRAGDADYNKHKYVDKYGHQQFMENYFPFGENVPMTFRHLDVLDTRLRELSHVATKWLCRADQHHAIYPPFTQQMVCKLPFTCNNTNYISDMDHDENSRKFWFLVFGRGLYTKKADADAAAEHVDGVHIFKTRAQGTRAWARHCHRQHTDGCHKTTGARAYESDADSDIDDDTEGPKARVWVLTAIASPKDVHQARARRVDPARRAQRVDPACRVCQTIKCAASVPVKRAPSASVPVMRRTVKAELVSPPKKIPLYADCKDSDLEEDLFKSDSSIEVPLATSRAASRQKSTLDEDEDMPMPPASAPPTTNLFSPTISSASSLSATSMAPSIYSSVSASLAIRVASAPAAPAAAPATSSSGGRGSPRVATGSRGHPVSISAHLLYNRRTGVLYEDPEKGVEEMGRGDSMEVVKRGNIAQWCLTSSGENLGTLRNHDMPDDAQDDSNNESDAHGSDAHSNGSDGDSHSPTREKIRRIVDFEVEDSEWEDLVDNTLWPGSYNTPEP
ncbi:hypothetical protein B0H14DRAFT_2604160 [Mycena olivaceomarginata]|nr:hypothetical protein B0H14DRAFT_2604160 [Mycena olivaceomarginata]